MEIELMNVGYQPIYVEYQTYNVLIKPGEKKFFKFVKYFDFKVKHLIADTNNSWMYLLSSIVSYEQSRIEFVVDGEYHFEPVENITLLKVKSNEYVFDKNVSYNTFVFNCSPKNIKCVRYFVPARKTILKKCRFLYLFGGTKTLFPICLILFLVSLLCVLFEIKLFENILFTIGSGIITVVLGASYLKSLRILDEASKEDQIRKYMNSPRIEYRMLEDAMLQKYYNANSDDECYW